MRYYSYNLHEGGVDTVSEKEIVDMYHQWWYDRMCAKFGADHVNATYSYLDCIDDWVVSNLAWESTDDA